MHELRQAAKLAKQTYDDAVTRRAVSQRIVTELLQRKSSWTDDDVSRFTQLVREDHLCEQEEIQTKAAAQKAEDSVENQFNGLMHALLTRYHEEQVWSDKIRSASTYGSLAALGLNLLVFVFAIIVVEPWKRNRLLQSFEQRVTQMNDRIQADIEDGVRDLRDQQVKQETTLKEMIAIAQASVRQPVHSAADLGEQEFIEHSGVNVFQTFDKRTMMVTVSSAVVFAALGWLLGTKFG